MNQGASQFHIQLSDGQRFGPAEMSMIQQWAWEGRVPMDAVLVSADGTTVKSVLAEPALRDVLQTLFAPAATAPMMPTSAVPSVPPMSPGQGPAQDGSMSGMIPYKNPPALIGYYLAVFSLLFGILLSLPALILGIIGLRKRLKDPSCRGLVHAWIAIILGSIVSIVWGLIIAAIISNS